MCIDCKVETYDHSCQCCMGTRCKCLSMCSPCSYYKNAWARDETIRTFNSLRRKFICLECHQCWKSKNSQYTNIDNFTLGKCHSCKSDNIKEVGATFRPPTKTDSVAWKKIISEIDQLNNEQTILKYTYCPRKLLDDNYDIAYAQYLQLCDNGTLIEKRKDYYSNQSVTFKNRKHLKLPKIKWLPKDKI